MAKDHKKLVKEEWKYYGRWVQPTLSGTFWSHCHEAASLSKIFPDHTFTPLLFLDGHTLTYMEDERWMETFISHVAGSKQRTEGLYDQVESIAAVCEREHLSLLEKRSLPVDGYLSELFCTYREMAGVWWFLIVLSAALERYVLSKSLARDEEEMSHFVARYHRPTWLEEQTREGKALAEYVPKNFPTIPPERITLELIQSNPEIIKKVNEHVKEYEWFGTHHWGGEGYTVLKCIEDIRQVYARTGASSPKEKKGSVPGNHESIWKLIALFSYGRTHCAEVTAKVVYHSRAILIEQAEWWGISYDALCYLSAHEIEASLGKHSITLPKDLDERRAGYGCLIKDGEEEIITGKMLKGAIDIVVEAPAEKTNELRGSIASKGDVVKGIARVIISPKDFSRFFTGEILVAPETTPDFVPLMKLASALVTDVGGITSHAAIVSRELGKPCITGTKIGTQVIKDGDILEVDANRGIVKIINK